MCVPLSASPIIAAFQRAAATPRNIDSSSPTDQTETSDVTQTTPQCSTQQNDKFTDTKKALSQVLTIAERAKVAAWMTKTASRDGSKHIASKTVAQFPVFFRGSMKANLQKASRIWRSRLQYDDEQGDIQTRGSCSSISRSTHLGLKRVNLKAREGRGRKSRAWVQGIHLEMIEEFDRLRKLGVKFNWKVLQALSLTLITRSTSIVYGRNTIDARSKKPISQCISRRWIQSFMDRYRIVSKAHTGKLMLSPAKTEIIHKEVAYHLGKVSREFSSGRWKEEDVENADETHFVINVDNGKTLGFCGEKEVKYCDVVSGGEGMTIVVRLSGGSHSRIEPAFMVFTNKSRSYPIRGVSDDVPGVSYRTGPKGWIDIFVMPQWFSEPRAIRELPNDRKRILFVDNCSGHNPTRALEEAMQRINTEVHYFPPNATHLVQPADCFVIQKIKSAWSTRWEKYKMEMIAKGAWSESGKLVNPGKRFFLKLAAAAINDVNQQRDVDGLTYARKAMVRCGLACNLNGLWEERQLYPELQQIIAKKWNHFNGELVTNEQ